MSNDKQPEQKPPEAFTITTEQLQFVISFAQSVPLPRNQTDELVRVLQQVSTQPVTGDSPPGLKLAEG